MMTRTVCIITNKARAKQHAGLSSVATKAINKARRLAENKVTL